MINLMINNDQRHGTISTIKKQDEIRNEDQELKRRTRNFYNNKKKKHIQSK